MKTLAINEYSYLILAWCSRLCRVACLLHWRKTPILRRGSDSPTGAINGRQIIKQPSYDSTKNLNYGCYIFALDMSRGGHHFSASIHKCCSSHPGDIRKSHAHFRLYRQPKRHALWAFFNQRAHANEIAAGQPRLSH
jgi:hypothetical protein